MLPPRVTGIPSRRRYSQMLQSVSELQSYSIGATDGVIGRVRDIYFDDGSWNVRYFVVETGVWLTSRKILICPVSVKTADRATKSLRVSISKRQVHGSPEIDVDKPISRQHEMRLLGYYRYPHYWGGGGQSAARGLGYGGITPAYRRDMEDRARVGAIDELKRYVHDDHHLRSCEKVMNSLVQAPDGDIGRVRDFLVDEATWAIRYLVVDTEDWWAGHRVLVDPRWTVNDHWSASRVSVKCTREFLQNAPPYTSVAGCPK
jgi:sporulation protein YlmC with PRC-barrel domain